MNSKKILHYCWFGKGAKPPDVLRCQASWSRYLDGYEIREWNEGNCSLENGYLKAAYERGLWSKVSNLIRLQVLWQHGGIYLDTDIEVLRDFDDLLGEGCVVGFQQEKHDTDWANNAVIVARAGHPFLKDCIDLTLEHFEKTGEFLRSPIVTTAVLKEWGLVKYGSQGASYHDEDRQTG
jgi:mannosyltransferase OCH1-like enzyme